MTTIFADTFYWVALANPKDARHEEARTWARWADLRVLTTDEALIEFLTLFARHGSRCRLTATEMVREVLSDPAVVVVPQTRASFLEGLRLYESRPDKAYSLTDCICMNTMREYGLADVLTGDGHFRQEGFRVLFEDASL